MVDKNCNVALKPGERFFIVKGSIRDAKATAIGPSSRLSFRCTFSETAGGNRTPCNRTTTKERGEDSGKLDAGSASGIREVAGRFCGVGKGRSALSEERDAAALRSLCSEQGRFRIVTRKANKADRRSDLLSIALAERRRQGDRQAKAEPPIDSRCVPPTPEEDARSDFLASLSREALRRLRRFTQELRDLDGEGRLYLSPDSDDG
jgi:hypothetical protein